MNIPWRFVTLLSLISCLPVPGQRAPDQSPRSGAETKPAVQVAGGDRVRLGGFAGAGYRQYAWPGYGYWPPFYDPLSPFFSPYSSPAYFSGAFYPVWQNGLTGREGRGEIRLQTNLPGADVFLDDAWAGIASDLKTIRLKPGVYNLKLTSEHHQPFQIRLYVLSGKTLKVNAPLRPDTEVRNP